MRVSWPSFLRCKFQRLGITGLGCKGRRCTRFKIRVQGVRFILQRRGSGC